jgi:soluble lytic murein transglycosylase-like protein
MKASRLALPLAALAAIGVSIATAEDKPVRDVPAQEASVEHPEANAPVSTQLANTSNNQQEEPAVNNQQEEPAVAANPATASAIAAPSIAGNDGVRALIDRYAAVHSIPAAFARAVVHVESSFKPDATGRHGEVGLMQIKYETARGIGFTGTREELYDPETNLEWGMKYLATSWKLGRNTPCGAVLRYNAGHGATRPTAATKVYCAKVRKHMASN